MTVREYEELRSVPEQFVIAQGHAAPDIEDVVAKGEGWQIVRKRSGKPAEIARARATLGPRAGCSRACAAGAARAW